MCFVNIHIQNSLTKYGFWSASEVIYDKHFLISIFFPHARLEKRVVSRTRASPLFITIHTPHPPSTKSWSTELLYGILTENQNDYTKISW